MERSLRQLQFGIGFLTTFRTGLACLLRWHLMEMLTIMLCYPVAPFKEHTPSSISNRLGKVSVPYHVLGLEFVDNNRDLKTFVMQKLIHCFREKVKTLASDNIHLLCQRVFRLPPSLAPILLARKVAVQPLKFTRRLVVKARIRYLLSIRSREKVLCANVNTDSRLRNTFHCVWHFTDDRGIPATCRFFQRDLFRISDE